MRCRRGYTASLSRPVPKLRSARRRFASVRTVGRRGTSSFVATQTEPLQLRPDCWCDLGASVRTHPHMLRRGGVNRAPVEHMDGLTALVTRGAGSIQAHARARLNSSRDPGAVIIEMLQQRAGWSRRSYLWEQFRKAWLGGAHRPRRGSVRKQLFKRAFRRLVAERRVWVDGRGSRQGFCLRTSASGRPARASARTRRGMRRALSIVNVPEGARRRVG